MDSFPAPGSYSPQSSPQNLAASILSLGRRSAEAVPSSPVTLLRLRSTTPRFLLTGFGTRMSQRTWWFLEESSRTGRQIKGTTEVRFQVQNFIFPGLSVLGNGRCERVQMDWQQWYSFINKVLAALDIGHVVRI